MSSTQGVYPKLTERQSAVFNALLHQYITTACAVGSRTLAKRLDLDLSPATIRNVMADLEDLGLIVNKHTSSGRIPTTFGYGYYVDDMMEKVDLPPSDQVQIASAIEQIQFGGISDLLDRANEALARTSTLISVILTPNLAEGILHKIDLVRIASGRLLVVLSIRSGFVRSILLQISSNLSDTEIDVATRYLNDRLSGLTLGEVRRSITARLRGDERSNPVIRLMVGSANEIFKADDVDEIHVDGTANMIGHPEFADSSQMKGVIEILEDRDVILHILNGGAHQTSDGVSITIGEEIGSDSLENCSVLTANYTIGETEGLMGVIGPKRMNYARLTSLVNFAAAQINRKMVD